MGTKDIVDRGQLTRQSGLGPRTARVTGRPGSSKGTVVSTLSKRSSCVGVLVEKGHRISRLKGLKIVQWDRTVVSLKRW